MSVNKAILIGNLGRDPELRRTPQQLAVCSFSIATTERRKDPNTGSWSDHTDWHNVVTFGNVAENCARFLKKGRQVYVEGRIQTRKWQDREGRDRYTTEVIANTVQFLGGRDGAGEPSRPLEQEAGFDDDLIGPVPLSTNRAVNDETTLDDDDIPF